MISSLSKSQLLHKLMLNKRCYQSQSAPSVARTVIIGGGVIGSSVAYHLAKFGRKDICILEQGRISCGTSWHAAGLVGQLRNTPSEIYLSCYGSQLYAEMEKETGQATGFKRCGSITLAQTDDRMIALKRNVARAKAFNIDAHMVSPQEANELLGGMIETSDLKGALWLPGDGTVSPSDLTASYIAGAKKMGVRVFEGLKVTGFGIDMQKQRVQSVRTNQGVIECEEVINCGGQWARNIGKMAGVNVPLHSAEHFYIITEPSNPSIPTNMPLFRDPDSYTYFREWSGGLVAGGFEPDCKPCFQVKNQLNQIPDNFEFQLFQEDWDHFSILMEGSLKRIPSLGKMGIRQMVNGPESFTPDNQYILGEAPELRKFYVAAGFNSSGIASSGGAGRALAEWVINDKPPLDLWTVDIRRFSPYQNNGRYLHDRTLETLGLHYQISYPKRELESARHLRKSVIYECLKQKGAVFGNKFGWERPNYFSGDPSAYDQRNLTFGKPNWFEDSRSEHLACRDRVAIFDQSSFAKLLIQGRDACQYLQRLCSNDLDTEIGKIVYTGMLNDDGGMETDCTITRLAAYEFLLITSTAQGTRDADWLKRNMRTDEFVTCTDVTSAYSVLSLMGPKSRALLSAITTESLDNETFPFGTSKMIELGYATVRANRITYVGELGWELYVPTEMADYVYEQLSRVGKDFGLKDAGYYAIDSLRLEKGFRAWGAELSPDWTPYECGLGFAVKLKKDVDFIGKKALLARKKADSSAEHRPARQLMLFTVDDADAFPWGGEPILREGKTVGYVTSAGYGHSIGRGIVFAMIKEDASATSVRLASDNYAIEINGKNYGLTHCVKPPYDPSSAKIKA